MKYLCLIYDDEKKWETMSKAEADAYMGEYFQFTENIKIRPTLTSNSLTALKRFVASENCVTLIGEFAAYREIASGELAVVPVDYPLFRGIKARLLVKSGRPLVAAAHELLDWILQRMSMFAGDAGTKRA